MDRRIIILFISIITILVALFLIVLSLFIKNTTWQFLLILGLGTALLPAGIFALLGDISFSQLILGTVVKIIQEWGEKHVNSVDHKINDLSSNLDKSLTTLSTSTEYLSKSKTLGIAMAHPDRRAALAHFLPYLTTYVANQSVANRKLVIVASSIKGVIQRYPEIGKQFTSVIQNAVKFGCDVKVLLTHPAYSRYREIQESRQEYDIAKEILHAINWLEENGVAPTDIKVYKGTPTTFMVSTSERMLLNFYPYETEAFNCFCLEVQDTGEDACVYRSFYDNHFHKPWIGEHKGKDHYLQTNSLQYIHQHLDGPVSDPKYVLPDMEGPYGDFFVIDDEGSFYIAVNIRGLKREIVYQRSPDGSQKCIHVGNTLEVRLLNLAEGQNAGWKTVGQISIDDEHRSGYWEATIREGTFKSLSMLGLFDLNNDNIFKHVSSHSLLKDKPLPLLYKWLVPQPIAEAHTES